jgi:hypothetical protein
MGGSGGLVVVPRQRTDRAASIKKAHPFAGWAFSVGRLAVTYFRAGNPHYHRRRVVSPSCSGWEGVGPTRYGRQANCWVRRPDWTPLPHSLGYGFNNPEEVQLGLNRQHKHLASLVLSQS